MKAIIILGLAAVAFATSSPKPLVHFMDAENSRVGRIRSGTPVEDIKNFAFQILLTYNGDFTCGGSIYSKDWVITAAHCIDGRPASTLAVQVGSLKANGEGGKTYKVRRAIGHESYGNFINDVALIQVEEPFEWSPSVQPIKIRQPHPPTNETVTLSGFGRQASGGAVSEELHHINSTVQSRTTCVVNTGITHGGTVCYYSRSGQGVCNGDSGGPATYTEGGNKFLVGVANFIIGSCGGGNPDGYASASYFQDWFDDTIKRFTD